jgi:hypothetical protein
MVRLSVGVPCGAQQRQGGARLIGKPHGPALQAMRCIITKLVDAGHRRGRGADKATAPSATPARFDLVRLLASRRTKAIPKPARESSRH